MSRNVPGFCIAITLLAGTASAATFVVPTDRDLIHRTDAIVIGSALVSYTQPTPRGGIETVTSVSIEEVVKGTVTGDTINVVEPGGVFGERAQIISGVPRFTDGQRVVLFLRKTGRDRWSATELVLGKFTFATAGSETLLLRDESEIVGWDPDLTQHREPRRVAAQFLQFIRDEVHGRTPNASYFSEVPAVTSPEPGTSPKFAGASNFLATALAFTASSYTMTMSGSSGGRWNVFPNAVSWFSSVGGEPGAPGGGATAINTAFASWNGDLLSNVNYVYSGTDNGSHTQGLHGTDNANTILFERDLSSWGAAPFTCSGGGYSGTLGIGGVSQASGTNTVNGETFFTTKEADVEMNKGIANCTALFNNGDWNSAVTHEFGHTLGFRHSDQNRGSNGSCSGDPTLECSTGAIMTAVVTHGINGALQAWDQNAVRAVYPMTSPPPPPPPPPPPAGNAYDGDGKADLAIFRPNGATWFIQRSSGGAVMIQWGLGTDTPLPGDYDGDGTPDLAVWRPSDGAWYIRNSTGSQVASQWGATGDTPISADFDGDRRTDFAIWRPSSATFWVRTWTGAVTIQQWGLTTDLPAVADFNGDGKADFAVWRPSNGTWYVKFSSGGQTARQWGAAGDIPVPADYDGDGKADFAVWRPSTGVWYIVNSSTGAVSTFQLGSGSDQPVPRDYDGDGKADPAVWRPSTGMWSIRLSSTGVIQNTQWGQTADIPVPR